MKRTLPGLALAACWLLLLLKGPFSLIWATMVLIAFVGGLEYVAMAAHKDIGLGQKILLSSILAVPVLTSGTGSAVAMTGGVFLAFFLLSCYVLFNFRYVANSYETFSRYALGIIYIGFLFAHLVLICRLPDGTRWIVILTSITAGSDSGAYYCGRLFGSRKLCSNISPKKTIEGALGGLFFGLLFSAIFAGILLAHVNWFFLLPASVLLTGVGILGDLSESVMKRGTDTKDSGKILAGHGGILDRIDSLLFAGPVLYYMLVLAG